MQLIGIYRVVEHQVTKFNRKDWTPPARTEMDDGYWNVFAKISPNGSPSGPNGSNYSNDSGFGSARAPPAAATLSVGEMDECSECRENDHYHHIRPPVSRMANALSRNAAATRLATAKEPPAKESKFCTLVWS